MSNETSRRRFIGSAGLIAAAAVAPLASAAEHGGPPVVTSRLKRMIGYHDRASAAHELHYRNVEKPADDAWRTAVSACPAEPPPAHEESATTFVNYAGDTVRLSTEQAWLAGTARHVVGDPSWADMGDGGWRQAHREIAPAFDRRNAVLAAQAARRKAFEAEARERFGIDALSARGDALDERRRNASDAVIAFPAAGLADVVAKLDFVSRVNGDVEVNVDAFAAISSDVRRLATMGAQ